MKWSKGKRCAKLPPARRATPSQAVRAGCWTWPVLLLLVLLLFALAGCEGEKALCERGCREVGLGFFAYDPGGVDGDLDALPPACWCEKAGGELFRLW